MKHMRLTELLAAIRATFVSFFSIVMFVALGAAVFLGLQWGRQALSTTLDTTLAQTSFHDIELQYPYGITDESIEELCDIEGVELVEPGYAAFIEGEVGKTGASFKVQSITDALDQPEVVKGKLPTKENEIALLDHWAEARGVKVGDTFSLTTGKTPALKFLTDDHLTVTALVKAPGYLSTDSKTYGASTSSSGTIDCVAFVTEEAFSKIPFLDAHPIVYIRCASTQGLSTFAQSYRDIVTPVRDRIAELGAIDAPERFEEVRTSLQETVAEGQVAMSNPETLALLGGSAEKAEQLLESGSSYVADMRDTGWIVLTRDGNGGIIMANTFVSILSRLSISMASLFLVVGLLVCYSAMSRMIHEQVVQVGTKKALGFRRGEITRLYLCYAGIAVIAGMIIGAAAAVFVVQAILNPVIAHCFTCGQYPAFFSLAQTLGLGAVEMVLILLTTWLSCANVLRKDAVRLLVGTEPPTAHKRFYERWGVWKRLPLLYQTIVNNCLNDKRRMAGTIIGVAGCTALVVCALTLNNDVLASFDQQYTDEFGFNAVVALNPIVTDAQTSVGDAIAKLGGQSTPVNRRATAIEDGHGSLAIANLVVPMDEKSFFELYRMHPTSGDAVDLSQEGVWISAGYGDKSGVKVGDEVLVRGPGGGATSTKVLGYYTYYLIVPDVVMGASTYQKLFGIAPSANMLFADTAGLNEAEFRTALRDTKGLAWSYDYKAETRGAFDQFQRLSRTVVFVYLGLSTLMAIVVLLNLNMMFIDEKRRELTVLMICGFSVRQAKGYVRNDTIALTALGIILGILLGSAVGYATVVSVEPTNVLFVRTPNIPACLIGAAVSAVLAAIMGAIALRRIPRFDLTDINRF